MHEQGASEVFHAKNLRHHRIIRMSHMLHQSCKAGYRHASRARQLRECEAGVRALCSAQLSVSCFSDESHRCDTCHVSRQRCTQVCRR